MDFKDKLKKFFGFSNNKEKHEPEPKEYYPPRQYYDRSEYEGERMPDAFEVPIRGFDVFTDPLHMHQYFEQQMKDMLKMFGFHGFGDSFFGDSFNMPEHDGHNFFTPHTEQPADLREHYLKDCYEKPHGQNEKLDKDIDGKLNMRDLESIFGGSSSKQMVPYQQPQNRSSSYFYGQSVTSKTVRNADGSVEIHKTVRDNDGNEETTVSRKLGDKEYSVTTKRNKHGQEEIIENLVNLEENEKDLFVKSTPTVPRINPSSLYDKFFK